MTGSPAVAVGLKEVTVDFGPTRALDAVSVEARRGEVLALMGGNGSGKSTLIKVLAGLQAARPGGVLVSGGKEIPLERHTPGLARENGLRFVHQHPGLFPDLSVAENLAIGHGFPKSALGTVSWRELRAHAREVLDRFHVDVPTGAAAGRLSPALQMMVSIARALQGQEPGRGVLVLDEPTASLGSGDAEELVTALRGYADTGVAIIYVSHRLREVAALADRAVVLRDGTVSARYERGEVTEKRLVRAIVGGAGGDASWDGFEHGGTAAEPGLEVRDLSVGPLQGVSLLARKGQVTGVAGLVGSGRSSLLRGIFGAQATREGAVLVDGEAFSPTGTGHAVRSGIAYIPENRQSEAAFGDLSVRENLSAARVRAFRRWGRIHRRAERADARDTVRRFGIRCESVEADFGTLSGGNQQRVVIARWLRRDPRVLLLDEPTQGVDIGARKDIHRMVRTAVAAGSTALIASSDFEELAAVCDRVYVVARGRVVAELAAPDIDAGRLEEIAHLGVPA